MIIIDISEYLNDLRERGFYGEVVLIYENGRICRVKTTESHLVKQPDLRE